MSLVDSTAILGIDELWPVLLFLARQSYRGDVREELVWIHKDGTEFETSQSQTGAFMELSLSPLEARFSSPIAPEAQTLLDIYLPLVAGPASDRMVVAHLGQSVDGRIATQNGVSQFITGAENLEHTHRLRALFDAVVIGVDTALGDDPQLTTRRVDGPHPTRIVLDPRGRLGEDARLLNSDEARTLIVSIGESNASTSKRIFLPSVDGILQPSAILAALADRGLPRIFIEGGGVTVSHFIEAELLDRLHLCIAPVILGSGRPSIRLPEIRDLSEARPLHCRHFQSGPDLLFDCVFVDGDGH